MAYYVGSITHNYQQKGLVKSVPSGFEDSFRVKNSGTGLSVELRQYVLGNYFLPQGALLARMLVNGRLVVDGLSVTDYYLPQINQSQHRWEVSFDIGSSDLVKLADSQPILVDFIEMQFYVNEDGLRSVQIEEKNRANSFDFFKQDVAYEASETGFRSFWFYPSIRHDFQDSEPFVTDFISDISQAVNSSAGYSRGLRFVIAPLFDPSGFLFEHLYKVQVYSVSYDAEGKPIDLEEPFSYVGDLKVSGEQLSVNYKTDSLKDSLTIGPLVTAGPYNQPNGSNIGSLPSTRFFDHRLSVDPLGARGLLFLEPASVKSDWSASIAANDWLMRFSLASYFAVNRDLTAELLVQSKSDLSLLSSFRSEDVK